MNLEDFREFCLTFTGSTEDHPFEDENILAFKVMDKIYAIADTDKFKSIDLKCDPVKASMLRNLYQEVQPGQFKDKRSWNTIDTEGALDDELIKEWIKDSYSLVVETLSRKKQKKLEKMDED
ncbi:MmcQ/YjbR family DNA-binding protein [Fodinibius sediminis]|uniref:Predicted DNA-binding protein, MmcQ/YjbR family n=1 Tax=Fodinibius sediminis TaxID=1214077 RepID=A0A521DGL5_9BACT|nr:MmcQ/YjbR family DNA-binding protein [Fodinibius sediminis]SMO70070.1 Predicted DNA-binding protein, MmcQ/YjbR family [Fodinibius sediminis]